MKQNEIKNLELTLAMDKGLNPASPLFLFNTKGMYFQGAINRQDETKHFTLDEINRLKEICKWEKLILIPDNTR